MKKGSPKEPELAACPEQGNVQMINVGGIGGSFKRKVKRGDEGMPPLQRSDILLHKLP